jgi:AcrR family transcriptional regulator
MPATRPHLDRDAKRAEILDAAEPLLLRHGYDETTMAAVAQAARVASNAVYWYFPSKDDLLAAVLRRRQERALAAVAERGDDDLEQRVSALLAQLDQVANLTASVHDRARHSDAVAEVHRAFHTAADAYLQTAFRDAGLARADATRAAGAIMAMVEGIHLHQRSRDRSARDRLIGWTLRRLVAGTPSSAPG